MDVGVHLPLADLGEGTPTGKRLRDYTTTAATLNFRTVAANDHLVWQRAWLDGPTALASILGSAGPMTLATSIALPAVRHPVVLAKALASLAVLTNNPLIVGLGPGSSAADYQAVGVPFAQRWARFDEALRLVRALLRGQPAPGGRFYPADGVSLDPLPFNPPSVWFGSWGSDMRLRSMAAVADGWMASAYNTTPDGFAEARARLDSHLTAAGRDPAAFPNLVATAWTYVTPDRNEARHVLEDFLAPLLHRDPDELATQLPIGTPDHCSGLLEAYAQAGAHQILLWPIRDPVRQLEIFAEQVRRPATGS